MEGRSSRCQLHSGAPATDREAEEPERDNSSVPVCSDFPSGGCANLASSVLILECGGENASFKRQLPSKREMVNKIFFFLAV